MKTNLTRKAVSAHLSFQARLSETGCESYAKGETRGNNEVAWPVQKFSSIDAAMDFVISKLNLDETLIVWDYDFGQFIAEYECVILGRVTIAQDPIVSDLPHWTTLMV